MTSTNIMAKEMAKNEGTGSASGAGGEQNVNVLKSAHALREEATLKSWKEKQIFEKSLLKNASKDGFIFYEGPPTANGHPGIHHLEARAFKDAIPRYKTMRGYYVRRKGGWDTHGLPVELQVEKELGLKSKKEIEKFGVAAFNEKCKESVWRYVHEWEEFTDRIGYWVDLKNPYVTYKPEYIESLWNIVKTVDSQNLLYKDYKVVPWCPRCGTGLSSHELAQGYEKVKDLSLYVKFKIQNQKTYLLAWTTTPWTLPGNVALAVGSDIEYVKTKIGDEIIILAKSRLSVLKDAKYEIVETVKGKDLVGLEYEPLYPFITDSVGGAEKEKLANAYKVYAADFVTTEDGTGIVHTAVMYGQDDFELGTKVGLPKYHLVAEDGTFKNEAGFLAGTFVKNEETEVAILKDLASRNLLFGKEKHEHDYPFCWRCHTALIYFARDSWYIKMSALRSKLISENEKIHWEPDYIKNGRFGEWLSEVKDWAISRERYWGTPLPVWVCKKCGKRKTAGSIADVSRKPRNIYFVMRHGEAENNVNGMLDSSIDSTCHLTSNGKADIEDTVKTKLKKVKFDLIFSSPLLRTRETAEAVKKDLGLPDLPIIVDERLKELGMGEFNGRPSEELDTEFPLEKRFAKASKGIEDYSLLKKRIGGFLYEIESKYDGKNILIVTHGAPIIMLIAAARGLNREEAIEYEKNYYLSKGDSIRLDFSILPHNEEYELDLHRPYIDAVKLKCSCGEEMLRVKEVMDVWFDSGAMPFAQDHYPFKANVKEEEQKLENEEKPTEVEEEIAEEEIKEIGGLKYPADFISEAIDQTRGWFYTLHAIGVLMGKGRAYKNVICLGHVLDAQGKKMSKSIGNVVDPWKMMDKYGADALRFWMYSVNQPGESKNFDEKTVDEIVKKVFNLALNAAAFYSMHADKDVKSGIEYASKIHVLDHWILSQLNKLIQTVTANLDNYLFLESTRAIREFMADLSQWYIRRSRDRFKSEDKEERDGALLATRHVLLTLSKIMAPFTPFFADHLYASAGGLVESVHLEEWPKLGNIDEQLLASMEIVRAIASKGLEARMASKINVRQPLQSLKVNRAFIQSANKNADKLLHKSKYFEELIGLVKDEVNVKEVIFVNEIIGHDGAKTIEDVELDTVISPQLKEEGELRELIRKIQDLRKEKGLKMGDAASLTVAADLRGIVSKNEAQIKKLTNLKKIDIGDKFEIKVNL